MLYYTSATTCFLPKARVLGKTLKKYNPDAKFYLLLSDKLPEDFSLEDEPFDGVLQSDEIELNCDMSVPFWFYLHDVTELCTAVKGWGALKLLELTGEDKIVYLDPDIAVFHSLDKLEKMLDEHDIIITPHRLAPEPRFDDRFYGDHQLYTRGVYNLGFLAVKKTEQGVAFLQWWRKMLETLCYVDDPNGLFTDQKLIDMAPAFFDKLYICRDEGYNISWWNITQREISGTVDDLRENGKPVYFYHFSNYDSGLHKKVIEDHCNDNSSLWALYDWYTEQQIENGYNELRKYPCIYNTYDNGEPITHTARENSRKRSDIMAEYRHTDPFVTGEKDSLYRYYKKNYPYYLEGGQKNIPSSWEAAQCYEEYMRILNSRSYRFGSKVMAFACWLLPPGGVRRQALAKCWRALKKIIRALRGIEEAGNDKEEAEELVIEQLTFEKADAPVFSILITDADSFQETYKSIKSIASSAEKGLPVEVIVSGHMSAENSQQLMETVKGLVFLPDVQFGELLSAASGKYILLFGEHLTMQEGYLSSALETLEETGAAMVQSKVCFADGKLYEAGGIITQSGVRISYGFGFNGELGCVRYNKEVDCVSLYGTLIDREALRSANGTDTEFTPLYQLADLSFRLREKGRTTKYIPALSLRDNRKFNEDLEPAGTREEAALFSRKWGDTLRKENIADASEIFTGRDRSKDRITIFSVDDRIPCYDESAGDRTTYHYYEVMAEMGYNLKIVADEMRRREPYATNLEKLGIEVVSADGGGDEEWRTFLRENGRFIDVAYLNRPHILTKYYDAVKQLTSAKIVYNCMDLHFLRETREAEVKNNQEELAKAGEKEREELGRMDLADVVFSVSTFEKTILDAKLKHAKVVLNPIFVYHDFPQKDFDFTKRKDLLFVGGFRHTPNVDAVKWMCKKIMPLINKALPDVKLHIVGSNPTAEVNALASKNVVCHGFLSEEELARLYDCSRVSVVPLRYGAGIKGKVLEAMYNGLPVVSTSIGTEGIVDIEQYIENTDDESSFANKVIEIYQDTEKLAEMGRNNQQYVKEHLGTASAEAMFREVFG